MIMLAIASIFLTTASTSTGTELSLPGPMRMLRVLVLITLAAWASLRIIFKPTRLTQSGAAALWMLAYALIATASALYSPTPALTLWKGFEVFAIVITAISLSDKFSQLEDIQRLVNIFSLFILFFVCDLLFSVLIAPGQAFANFAASTGRMAFAAHGIAPFFHPNSMTQAGAWLFSLTLASAIIPLTKSRQNVIKILLIIMASTAMILGHSRTSLFACMITIIIVLVYGGYIRTAITLGLLGSVAFLTTGATDYLVEFLLRGQNTEVFTSLSGRIHFWEDTWNAFKESPLFGKGFYAGQRELFGSSTVDNTYLEVLLNLGVVGFIVFLAPLAITFYTLFKSRPVLRTQPLLKLCWLQIASLFIIIFIRSLSGPTFQVLHLNLVFYSFIIIAARSLLSARRGHHVDEELNTESAHTGVANSRILRTRKPF